MFLGSLRQTFDLLVSWGAIQALQAQAELKLPRTIFKLQDFQTEIYSVKDTRRFYPTSK